MEVTKCDRCKRYVDKAQDEMPRIIYTFNYERRNAPNGDWNKKTVCYECYNEFLNWVNAKDQKPTAPIITDEDALKHDACIVDISNEIHSHVDKGEKEGIISCPFCGGSIHYNYEDPMAIIKAKCDSCDFVMFS